MQRGANKGFEEKTHVCWSDGARKRHTSPQTHQNAICSTLFKVKCFHSDGTSRALETAGTLETDITSPSDIGDVGNIPMSLLREGE